MAAKCVELFAPYDADFLDIEGCCTSADSAYVCFLGYIVDYQVAVFGGGSGRRCCVGDGTIIGLAIHDEGDYLCVLLLYKAM